ncbi:MAG: polysaccharide biosynthesis protein [Methylocella sp.]
MTASNSLDERSAPIKPTPRRPKSPTVPPQANIFRGALEHIVGSIVLPSLRVCGVRLPNLLCSSGSVVPTVWEAMQNGRTIQMTNSFVTRYFMTPQDAFNLICLTHNYANNGDILVPYVGAFRLGDVIEMLADLYCEKHGVNRQIIKTILIGARRGENLHERMVAEYEWARFIDKGTFGLLGSTDKTEAAVAQVARLTSSEYAVVDRPQLLGILSHVVANWRRQNCIE